MANLDERKKEIANLISKAQEAVEKGDLETARNLKADIDSKKKNMKNLNSFQKKLKHQYLSKMNRLKMKAQKLKITKVIILEKNQKINHLMTKRRNRQTKKNLMMHQNQMTNLKKHQKHLLLKK